MFKCMSLNYVLSRTLLFCFRKVHDSLELDRVPRVQRMKNSSGGEEADPRAVSCDVCKKESVNAVTFCVDCGKKMCKQHLEVGLFAKR